VNYVGTPTEALTATWTGTKEDQEAQASTHLIGLNPCQVEALFNMFKERERKDKINGKFVTTKWVLDSGASYHMTSDLNTTTTTTPK